MGHQALFHAQSDSGGVVLGVFVGLISACIQSVGLTLQRKSHLLEDNLEEELGQTRRPPYRRRRWQIGMFMFLVSNLVGSTIQITTLPLPVLSTLQASGLVFNTACASLLLHEPFTVFSIIGTLLVAGGAVLIALFGSMSEPSHNLDQLLILLGHHQFLIWLISSFIVVAVIIVTIGFQERAVTRQNHRGRLLLGLAYGSVSGILSAHTLLLAKSAVELLVRTIVDRINQFNRWQSWMILVGLVVLALSQLYFLHRGLRLCSTSVLYPFVFCIYNIVAILDGLIYFRQTSRLTVLHACLVALGTVVLLAGVFALSWRLGPEYQADSSTGDSKTLARVQTPHTALAPGLGIVDTEEDIFTQNEGDDEDSVHPLTASEITPLLRSSTAPVGKAARRSSSQRNSLRPPRLRRVTAVPEESTNLWEELNNDDNASLRFSGKVSPLVNRSPSATKLRQPSRRHRHTISTPLSSSVASAKNLVTSIRWPSWSQGYGSLSTGDLIPPQDGDDTDEEPHQEGTVRRHPRPELDRSRSEGTSQGKDGWFKMGWWKGRRKWWDHDQDDNSPSAV